MKDRNDVVDRIAAAVPEQRRALGLSLRRLADLADVHRADVIRVDRGLPVPPSVLMRVATALTVWELNTPVEPVDVREEPVQDDPVMVLALRPVLARAPVRTLGGAA